MKTLVRYYVVHASEIGFESLESATTYIQEHHREDAHNWRAVPVVLTLDASLGTPILAEDQPRPSGETSFRRCRAQVSLRTDFFLKELPK